MYICMYNYLFVRALLAANWFVVFDGLLSVHTLFEFASMSKLSVLLVVCCFAVTLLHWTKYPCIAQQPHTYWCVLCSLLSVRKKSRTRNTASKQATEIHLMRKHPSRHTDAVHHADSHRLYKYGSVEICLAYPFWLKFNSFASQSNNNNRIGFPKDGGWPPAPLRTRGRNRPHTRLGVGGHGSAGQGWMGIYLFVYIYI